MSFSEFRPDLVPLENGNDLLQYLGFRRGDKEKLIVFWTRGPVDENGTDFAQLIVDVSIKGPIGKKGTLIDVLNGTETSLKVIRSSNSTVNERVHAESWPRIIRVSD